MLRLAASSRLQARSLVRIQPSVVLAKVILPPLCTASPISPLYSLSSKREMKIYTKTGDKGTSGLFNGERRPKEDDIFEALGVCDELNASVGISHELCEQAGGLQDICAMLEEISSRLFDVGSAIATPINTTESQSKLNHTHFDESHVDWLERRIDEMDNELPPLKNFILPSGGSAATNLHLSRTLARRAERRVWPLIHSNQCEEVIGRYLNRLSDFLFTAARIASKRTGNVEKIYKKARVITNDVTTKG